MSRAHDVIVYGATGFTGTLITRYIASKWADIPVDRWAIAGRDESKLKSLRQSLPRDDQKEKLRLMVIDASDRQQLKSMTSQTSVLINCVGPFVKYGEPVVEACVEAGTHYIDITGEPAFIKNIINKYHAQAQEKKILVIPASGFDSVPADIGVLYAEKRKAKKQLKQAEAYISTHGGGMSYGTYNTIIESLSNNAPKASRESVSESGQKRPPNIQRLIPHRSPNTNTWVFPFNFTSDPFVVTRSRRLLEEENFSFAEYLEMPNLISAILLAIVLFVFFLIIRIPGGKGASFLRSLRKEGSGPSEEVRKKATTSARFYVEDVDGNKSVARYAGPEGYEATALFATEAALTILRDVRFDSLPSSRTGVTTPAAALGEAYIDRLLSTGLVKFE